MFHSHSIYVDLLSELNKTNGIYYINNYKFLSITHSIKFFKKYQFDIKALHRYQSVDIRTHIIDTLLELENIVITDSIQ